MRSDNRVRGSVWVDLCDNCSEPIEIGIRWRRRRLCTDCADKAIRQELNHASMMLGEVARRRKERAERSRKDRDAARKRDTRRMRMAAEDRKDADRRQEAAEKARDFVEQIIADKPGPCPTCGKTDCSRHPYNVSEAGCEACGQYAGKHAMGCVVGPKRIWDPQKLRLEAEDL